VLIPACVPGVHATCASRVGLGYIDIYGLESDLRHALRKGLESKKNRGRAKRGPKILVYIYIYIYIYIYTSGTSAQAHKL
jgi:hypothetical protein